jgi:hypothetical protein
MKETGALELLVHLVELEVVIIGKLGRCTAVIFSSQPKVNAKKFNSCQWVLSGNFPVSAVRQLDPPKSHSFPQKLRF